MDDGPKGITPEELARKREWFEWYTNQLENHSVYEPLREGVLYHCPCCGYQTLSERGGYDICPVCFWEDDGQDDQDADMIRGGPNGAISLTQARDNYRTFGACDEKSISHVRRPLPEEEKRN